MVQDLSKSRMSLVFSACVLVALAGCRAEEQDRPQSFEPGVYQGQQDTALDADTLNDLRNRVSRQRSP